MGEIDIKTPLSFVLALLASVLLSVPASADGATVTHVNLKSFSGCHSYGPYTYCVVARGEENITSAPSGNWSGEAQISEAATYFVNGTQYGSSTGNLHVHILYADNGSVLKEKEVHQTGGYTFANVTCVYSQDLHIANGSIQYTNQTYTCS